MWNVFTSECLTLTFLPVFSRTLGGVPTQAPPPLEATSSSQIICPDGVTSANFYPETWVYMHPSQDFIQVPVSAEDKSYRIIYNLFHKTVPEFKYRILQILRVQNQFLWEKYKRWVSSMNKVQESLFLMYLMTNAEHNGKDLCGT